MKIARLSNRMPTTLKDCDKFSDIKKSCLEFGRSGLELEVKRACLAAVFSILSFMFSLNLQWICISVKLENIHYNNILPTNEKIPSHVLSQIDNCSNLYKLFRVLKFLNNFVFDYLSSSLCTFQSCCKSFVKIDCIYPNIFRDVPCQEQEWNVVIDLGAIYCILSNISDTVSVRAMIFGGHLYNWVKVCGLIWS